MAVLDHINLNGTEYDIHDAGAYRKPNGGIPKSDLADGVKESLNRADNAAPQSTTYTKSETDTKLSQKANSSSVYTKSETDERLAVKANASDVNSAIGNINAKIPSEASSANQLADKKFVNSSIATATATFRGTYNLVSDLAQQADASHAQIEAALGRTISGADNNDYAFVQVPTSTSTPTQIAKVERYKYNGTAWSFEYELNNSGFTASQWAAINSGITSSLVTKLSQLPTNAQLTTLLLGKQDVIQDLETIRSGAEKGATSVQPSDIVDSRGVFDLSAHNAVNGQLATYDNLSAALVALNALDSQYKYGGMSFKFVSSSDRKYVQARLMAQNFTTDITQWQCVDDEPTAGSHNLVESGGVINETLKQFVLTQLNTESYSNKMYRKFNPELSANVAYIISIIPTADFVSDVHLKSLPAQSSEGELIIQNVSFKQGQTVMLEVTPQIDILYILLPGASDTVENYSAQYGLKLDFTKCVQTIEQSFNNTQKSQALRNLGISGIDINPTHNSTNLVKSGGVDSRILLQNQKALEGGLVVETIESVLYSNWNKYIFVLPFDDKLVGKGIQTKVFCPDIIDGTYNFNGLSSLTNYASTTSDSISVTFEKGYATINTPSVLNNTNTIAWRIGISTWGFLSSVSKLYVFEKGIDIKFNLDKLNQIADPFVYFEADIEGSGINTSDGLPSASSNYNRSDFIEIVDGVLEIRVKNAIATNSYSPWWYNEYKQPLSVISTEILPKDAQRHDIIIQSSDIPTGAKYIIINSQVANPITISVKLDAFVAKNRYLIGKQMTEIEDISLRKYSIPYYEWIFTQGGTANDSDYWMGPKGGRMWVGSGLRKVHLKTIYGNTAKYEAFRAFDSAGSIVAKYTIGNVATETVLDTVIDINPNDDIRYINFAYYIDSNSSHDRSECNVDLYFTQDGFDEFMNRKIGNTDFLRVWSEINCVPYMYQETHYPSGDGTLSIPNAVLCIDTDTHTSSIDIFKQIFKWNENIFVNRAVGAYISLGDVLGATTRNDKQRYFNEWESMWLTLDNYAPCRKIGQLIVLGNHDLNQDAQTTVSNFAVKEDQYNAIIKPMLARFSSNHTALDTEGKFTDYKKYNIITSDLSQHPTWWYCDFAQNLRFIAIDAYDVDDSLLSLTYNSFKESTAYSENQLDFILSALTDAAENGLSVCFGVHYLYSATQDLHNSRQVLLDMIIAFRNKTEFSAVLYDALSPETAVKTYTANFSNSNGKIFILHGHGHYFYESQHSKVAIGPLTVKDFMLIAAESQASKMPRPNDMPSFDILCYNENEGIRFVRYGNAPGIYDINNNDGADYRGFHYADEPVDI